MSFFEDFKKFAMRGNVLDMAIGVIIGGAFSKIVSSAVTNVIMPPLSLLIGRVDFSNLFISLDGKTYDSLKTAQEAKAPIISYGIFLNSVLDFLIIALVIFCMIKQLNRILPQTPPKPVRKCPFCKSQIDNEATRCPYCTSEL